MTLLLSELKEFPMDELSAFATEVADWLSANEDELAEFRQPHPGAIEKTAEFERLLFRRLYDAGLTRRGWPVECGGLGGGLLLRAVFHEAFAAAGYPLMGKFEQLEVQGSTLLAYAPELAAQHLPAALRGDEQWAVALSEPGSGSDLASLRTRAVDDGDCYRIDGQKIWTTGGHLSRWSTLLARTGTAEDRHRGLTMFWVDHESTGVELRPIACATGRNELAEIFLDGVRVPKDRVIGEVNRGWKVTMHFMQFERGNFAWIRSAWLFGRLASALARAGAPAASGTAAIVGEAFLALCAVRERALGNVQRLAQGEFLGPEISESKILLSRAEQLVFDAVRELNPWTFELDDDLDSALNRQQWWFSRIVTIYGGASEVQHDLVAEQLMGLPRSR
jgi:alkylation response protein AidB-like acyl-CoA dehydrogenase